MGRRITQEGLELIKRHEGTILFVYDDHTGRAPVNGKFIGFPTIGTGHLIQPPETVEMYQNGITEEHADKLLRQDVAIAERAVVRLINVPLSDPQFDALVSWTFNLGSGALQRSTMRRKLNRGNYDAVPHEMSKWTLSKGRRLPGLVKRRKEEGSLFAAGTVLLQRDSHEETIRLAKASIKDDISTNEGVQSWVQTIFSRLKTGMRLAANSRREASQ